MLTGQQLFSGARCAFAELGGGGGGGSLRCPPSGGRPRAQAGGPPCAAARADADALVPRPAILADADVLKHIYSFLPAETVLEHSLVSREFLRVLSSTVTQLTLSPTAPVQRLLGRFANATRVALVGAHCAAGLRAGAAEHARACALPRLCEALAACPTLLSLDLTRCSPCDAAVARLREALPRCAALRELSLDQWSAPSSDAAVSLYAALSGAPSLDALYLSMARVRSVQHTLVPMLPRFRRLAAIDLSVNGLGAQGAALLRVALPGCALLESLNLASNSLADAGTELLASALPHCAALTELNLTANSIRAAGALALATHLPGCFALRHLWLGLNAVGPRGVEHLAAALPACRCGAAALPAAGAARGRAGPGRQGRVGSSKTLASSAHPTSSPPPRVRSPLPPPPNVERSAAS